MLKKILKWFRKNYHSITGSIAFLPAVVAVLFLIASFLMLQLDNSEIGKGIKSNLGSLSFKDADTARTVIATVLGSIITLTVFSFSMVMIVLNQAASQMSNRVLEGMIENRFQQWVLGVYIGSIVYALFLLSNIRDIQSGIYIPVLSIYLLLFLTVFVIFIFIYFLHYVTQSVKFETIINRVYDKTLHSMKNEITSKSENVILPKHGKQVIFSRRSGYFQNVNASLLANFAREKEGFFEFLYPPGSFLLKEVPFLNFYGSDKLTKEDLDEIFIAIDFFKGQPIEINNYYGFHQLTEVAIKALSPGINDPETAVLSIHALVDLLQYKSANFFNNIIDDDKGVARILLKKRTFIDLLDDCLLPIWRYGKEDPYIQNTLLEMTHQLLLNITEEKPKKYLEDFKALIQKEINKAHAEMV